MFVASIVHLLSEGADIGYCVSFLFGFMIICSLTYRLVRYMADLMKSNKEYYSTNEEHLDKIRLERRKKNEEDVRIYDFLRSLE